MKTVDYMDSSGQKRRVILKDSDPSEAVEIGIPVGPPDLNQIDWERFKVELNERLFSAGLYTNRDIQAHPNEFMAAVGLFRRYLVELYQANE